MSTFPSTQKRSRDVDDRDLSETTSPKRSRMNNPTPELAAPPTTSRPKSSSISPSSSSSSANNGNNATATANENHALAQGANVNLAHRTIPRQRNDPESSDATSPSSSSPDSTSSESTSSSGDDSDEEEEDEDSDEEADNNPSEEPLTNVPGRQKPRIHRVEKNLDILSRVSAFLPKMKDANESLEREIAAGRGADLRVDNVGEEDEGRYIEMNLGLGVLEEKKPDDNDSPSSDEDDDMRDSDEDGSSKQTDSNVMNKLMGTKQSMSKKPTIEEINQ
ncbi:hypothetical protein PHISCL_01891 [Aspergillus sclerotialis]|uniref:Uncharacterized protein n=1 Tax=Aspergillus sclerotialis TaxID=2070753 RepID=A0A3A2ZRJ8_9EURO|nr:hypothetical protein PHISCL_01891 [Aspergillus sclerotialis]